MFTLCVKFRCVACIPNCALQLHGSFVPQAFASATARFTAAAAPIAKPDYSCWDGSKESLKGDVTRLGPGAYMKLDDWTRRGWQSRYNAAAGVAGGGGNQGCNSSTVKGGFGSSSNRSFSAAAGGAAGGKKDSSGSSPGPGELMEKSG
jgi:hypothetical protein